MTQSLCGTDCKRLYSPGSTFKPLTAIAALETGNLNVNEIIEDEGIYKFYAGLSSRLAGFGANIN